MKLRCANCSKQLGLGVVSKSFWTGSWYRVLRFCGMTCRNTYTEERQTAIDRKVAVQRLFRT